MALAGFKNFYNDEEAAASALKRSFGTSQASKNL
jgi:hypothetical protein